MKRQRLDFNIWYIFKCTSVALLLAGAAILFYACENDIEKIKAFTSPEDLPMAEAIDFETMLTDSGKISFTLKAPKLKRYEMDGKEYTEFTEGMELKKYDSNGKVISSIRSDYAKQSMLDDKWEANNNVIATNINGDTLKTEHLIWEREKGIIYNDEYVKIISPDRIIWGDGFTSDEQMQDWRIKRPKGNIFVTVESEKSGNVETSKEGEMDTTEKQTVKGVLQFEQ